jgi:hypothetical protein
MAVLIAVGTWLVGWWCIPVLAVAHALIRRSSAAPIEAAIGAMIAWAALFLLNAGKPAFSVLLTRLGGVFPMPGAIVLAIAVLFAGILAWSAGRLTIGVRGLKV